MSYTRYKLIGTTCMPSLVMYLLVAERISSLFDAIYFCFVVVVLAQCSLFAEISTEQEERQTTLKYS